MISVNSHEMYLSDMWITRLEWVIVRWLLAISLTTSFWVATHALPMLALAMQNSDSWYRALPHSG